MLFGEFWKEVQHFTSFAGTCMQVLRLRKPVTDDRYFERKYSFNLSQQAYQCYLITSKVLWLVRKGINSVRWGHVHSKKI